MKKESICQKCKTNDQVNCILEAGMACEKAKPITKQVCRGNHLLTAQAVTGRGKE